MPAAPANPAVSDEDAGRSPAATRFVVRLGDEDGNAPTDDDEVSWLRCVGVELGPSGGDQVTLVYDLGETGERIVDIERPEGMTRQVAVYAVSTPGRTADDVQDGEEPREVETLLFAGEIDLQQLRIVRDEGVTLTGRLGPHHFGDVLLGPAVFDPTAAEGSYAVAVIGEDVAFNPLIDGRLEANRSAKIAGDDWKDSDTGLAASGEEGWYLWADPEANRTATARAYQGEPDELAEWSLRDAVESLCRLLNPGEDWVRNPVLKPDVFEDAPPVENVVLPCGSYLPGYLDSLLTLHGLAWFVAYYAADDGGITRRIIVHKRDAGVERTLRLPRPNTDAPAAKKNTTDATLTTDLADLANVVIGRGAYYEREVTVPLFRGWAEDKDSLTIDDLRISPGEADPPSVYEANRDVWRFWIGNEAGDYSGTRTTVDPIPDGPAFRHPRVKVYRRRRIDDCVTLGPDGKRLPPQLYWSADAGATWKLAPPEWSYHILETQIGIRFNANTPPEELVAAGDEARLRIVGTVVLDDRVTATADRRETSGNGREIKLYLDLGDRFQNRQRESSGDWASPLTGETDDRTDDPTDYVAKVRAVEEAAGLSADITIFGIDFGYLRGDLVTKIDGRNVSLNRNAKTAEEKRYLQIVGVSYDPAAQTTTLATRPAEFDPYLDRGPEDAAIGRREGRDVARVAT